MSKWWIGRTPGLSQGGGPAFSTEASSLVDMQVRASVELRDAPDVGCPLLLLEGAGEP